MAKSLSREICRSSGVLGTERLQFGLQPCPGDRRRVGAAEALAADVLHPATLAENNPLLRLAGRTHAGLPLLAPGQAVHGVAVEHGGVVGARRAAGGPHQLEAPDDR